MIGGYAGRILRVDLTKQKISTESISQDFMKAYLGGRGFGAKLLYDEVEPDVDPFGELNKIIFAIGPLTGTEVPSCSRYAVVTKSPLTKGYLVTLAGGWWPAELKRAGYDAILVQGASAEPVYLWVRNQDAELRDAKRFWGLWTSHTERFIKEELGDEKAKVASIGPAGENLVRYACVSSDMTDRRAGQAGRGGAGAVMGSKKLKAIAVRGTQRPRIDDRDLVKKVTKKIVDAQFEKSAEKPEKPSGIGIDVSRGVKPSHFSQHGTLGGLSVINELGIFPTRNFQTAVFPQSDKIDGTTVDKEVFVKHRGCYA